LNKNEGVASRQGLGAHRPETPPPPKLSPGEIKKIERWLDKNPPESTRGRFEKP